MPWGRIWPPSRRAPPRLRRTAWPSLRTWATGEGCATAGGGSSGGSVCGDARDEVGGATVEDLAHRLAVADGGGDHGRVVRRVRQADELRAITRHQHRPAACHPLGGDSAQSGGASGSASGRCLREVPQGVASGAGGVGLRVGYGLGGVLLTACAVEERGKVALALLGSVDVLRPEAAEGQTLLAQQLLRLHDRECGGVRRTARRHATSSALARPARRCAGVRYEADARQGRGRGAAGAREGGRACRCPLDLTAHISVIAPNSPLAGVYMPALLT